MTGNQRQSSQEGTAHLKRSEFAFGQLNLQRPKPQKLDRSRFRLAIFGDFSGRAGRGVLEIGDALAHRKPNILDPDTVEDVIEGFAADLVLPIGKDGTGVAVKLGGLDDLHPDELYENVELFSELVALRAQLSSGATAEHATRTLKAWGEKHGTVVKLQRAKSSGNAVPADLKLSEFQKLIGGSAATLAQASPIDDLLARVVGPYIQSVPDADAVAMQGAVDEALSAAMRLILHHPEFQSVEAQWRSLDLIARSVETDDTLDVVLYDVSAEEIATDLATADDLATSGFVRLLTNDQLDEPNGRGGYSALLGLYSFEETPPHAEILGRIAQVAAHVDAPFFAAISPLFLDVEKQDRHPLVAAAWDTLREMPEAKYLGIVSPRFLLRRPYGAKSDPIDEFSFEEFTMADGLGGMLWANPVVLVAILLAKSFRENGAGMGLGSIMSLDDMPYHFVTDGYGDQVAQPCTDRNFTLDKVEKAVVRGYMSVASIKGRDEVRLTSFQSLGGGEILGPWSNEVSPAASPTQPTSALDSNTNIELDDLLANFADDADKDNEGDIDADLAALLKDL
jgi:pilus assembly protein FimV